VFMFLAPECLRREGGGGGSHERARVPTRSHARLHALSNPGRAVLHHCPLLPNQTCGRFLARRVDCGVTAACTCILTTVDGSQSMRTQQQARCVHATSHERRQAMVRASLCVIDGMRAGAHTYAQFPVGEGLCINMGGWIPFRVRDTSAMSRQDNEHSTHTLPRICAPVMKSMHAHTHVPACASVCVFPPDDVDLTCTTGSVRSATRTS
jgi:hypothetical protein